jgi:hypothetical protein
MHCPQCGQQVVSDAVSFCNRCGFALDGVKDLLSPVPPDEQEDLPPSWLDIRVGGDLRSRRGLTQAALMLSLPLIIIFLMAMQGVFNVALVPQLFLGKAFFILLTLPILRFAYAVFEAKQEMDLKNRKEVGGRTHALSLPAGQSVPVTDFRKNAIDTAEMVQPASVTESTTKLLDQRENSQ